MIEVKNLTFSYTNQPYMENLSFQVKKGEIFGFLGPSGAGKSTLQKILTGVLNRYHGSVVVRGQEVKHAKRDFYEAIGVDFEFPSLYEKLTGLENIQYFASLYQNHLPIEPLMDKVGLRHDKDKRVSQYSKGMKSRLNFVKSLVHDPDILFLDEPTNGLDPNNAATMKQIILDLKKQGKTILLTTHNMHDAQELCDRVAFIVDGKVVCIDSPQRLILSRGASIIEYTYQTPEGEVKSVVKLSETGNDPVFIQVLLNNQLIRIHSSEPNLNDIFIELTGKQLQ